MNDQDASARIDLASLTYNFNVARAAAPTSQIMAVIKADAYGHGAEAVAKHLGSADAFAVARISEASRIARIWNQPSDHRFIGLNRSARAFA